MKLFFHNAHISQSSQIYLVFDLKPYMGNEHLKISVTWEKHFLKDRGSVGIPLTSFTLASSEDLNIQRRTYVVSFCVFQLFKVIGD